METKHKQGLLAFLIAGLALMLAGGLQAQDGPVFRIGVLDEPRGAITRGASLAVREINDAGGITGAEGTQFRVELVIEHPGPDETLEDAIRRLNQASLIAVMGPETTDTVLTHLPTLQSLNVPVLTPAIGDTVIASDSSARLFRIRASERLLGAALADYLVNEINVSNVTTVQLDRSSTGGRVGFSVALGNTSLAPQETTRLLEGDVNDFAAEIAASTPQTVVAYGQPEVTAEFYNALLDNGWGGTFAYPRADEEAFKEAVSLERLLGVYATTTWPVTAIDQTSAQFITDYIRTLGEAPGPIDAAAYDGVYLIREAAGQAGSLGDNLQTLRDFDGVQGRLNRSGLAPRETSDNVAVVELNALGGPEVEARYAGTTQLEPDEPVQIGSTPQPSPTPTPEGVVITVESARQNVRTGPGTNYDVLGQLPQGEQRQVIGANTDFSWAVINFRGQNGWMYVPIADIFGDRSTVPVFSPPPTPTPPPATNTPPPPPAPDVVVTGANPTNITFGVQTTVNVTVRNQGGADAGNFAVAATFPPDNQYSAVNVNGLAAGTERVIGLPVQLSSATGNFNVTIIADLNNQLNEGSGGEANNDDFTFNYKVDRQLILINSTTLGTGAQLDLEGNVTPQFDLTYTTSGLQTTASCTGSANCIGLLSPTFTYDTAHYDAINSGNGINQTSIPNASLSPGTTLGILTAEGRRGVIRVDGIQPGVSITLTYRVYS